ncbi:N-acetylglucosamine-6-phosphate deacetylase [Saccharococcus caldoxylosilyticus]|uniref:N-acetylglucosamine-6-phosphate deacetylase n=2 Tax=Saccharococcus caldoxylosilyticus TaxID=81408 RepID=A0A023DJ64_9BACL|nr:N-acetylglucosamine-6-phosphate deacetylase [Parageobacillus caldoxylosilyticus]KYD09816.1 N-acetylglucosamine-6-phosphate deacetylase [Parageobacillus caldoxylosilyticus]MBB3853789.1 N-acetylglucosamine-6-phosphate deacetylase [Parageobacillus caldoxylosilyticus]BDG36631.1 N-acetylglucosamine-6-phosphate deacetylase [Parageobacillus caldoxylosilyticus]BDG40419.1 N-acetylglucosamine-6-phosphate deacetylase [Parageobacillus caldoxylosilyticus]BDG44172.1 N-acetylglucosamine-6-phosphate deacet
MKRRLLKNAVIYAETGKIEQGYVLTEGDKIVEVGPMSSCPASSEAEVVELDPSFSVVPGFIDVHIHGASGADVMDATDEALRTMAKTLPKEGTTSFLATTMTAPIEQIERALQNVAQYIDRSNPSGEAEVLGIHLEGPFISPKRAGAQHPKNIIEPNIELFQNWQNIANGHIRLVTLAPEEKNGLALTAYLKEHGVVASIGHSDAVYKQVKAAIDAGVKHATHLFNGMRGIHHREPGVAGAVLMHEEVICELIADGVHVAPEMIRFAYQNKGSTGLILITDAMRAKCLGAGTYELGGQEVTVQGEKATLRDGTLAGSILKLGDAVKNAMVYTGCTLEDIIRMTSWNPAKQLGVLDRKGSIRAGKDADLVVLNEQHDVVMTICRGKLAYSK